VRERLYCRSEVAFDARCRRLVIEAMHELFNRLAVLAKCIRPGYERIKGIVLTKLARGRGPDRRHQPTSGAGFFIFGD
jgi:hypothetical protein